MSSLILVFSLAILSPCNCSLTFAVSNGFVATHAIVGASAEMSMLSAGATCTACWTMGTGGTIGTGNGNGGGIVDIRGTLSDYTNYGDKGVTILQPV